MNANLLEDVLSVTLQLSRQLQAREVGLDQEVCLGVRIVVLGPHQFEGHSGGQLLEQRVLLVADREALVLGCRGQDLDQPP